MVKCVVEFIPSPNAIPDEEGSFGKIVIKSLIEDDSILNTSKNNIIKIGEEFLCNINKRDTLLRTMYINPKKNSELLINDKFKKDQISFNLKIIGMLKQNISLIENLKTNFFSEYSINTDSESDSDTELNKYDSKHINSDDEIIF